MTGKCYYMTTLGDWQRHAARFANSHFIVLAPQGMANGAPAQADVDASAQILVLIEADEGVHLALDDEAAFEVLPHPLALYRSWPRIFAFLGEQLRMAARESALRHAPQGNAPRATARECLHP